MGSGHLSTQNVERILPFSGEISYVNCPGASGAPGQFSDPFGSISVGRHAGDGVAVGAEGAEAGAVVGNGLIDRAGGQGVGVVEVDTRYPSAA